MTKTRYTPAGAALHDLLAEWARVEPALGGLLPRGARGLLRELATGPPRTAAALARARGGTRQGVRRVAADLIRQGWLEALPNPRHRAAPLLALTGRGRARQEALVAAESRHLDALARGLDPAELRAARRLLARLGQRARAAPRGGRPPRLP